MAANSYHNQINGNGSLSEHGSATRRTIRNSVDSNPLGSSGDSSGPVDAAEQSLASNSGTVVLTGEVSVDTGSSCISEAPPTSSDEDIEIVPLKNSWTMWYFENIHGKNYDQNQTAIKSFDTVQGFWSIYNYIHKPSSLRSGCDYSLFKNGIKPMWEDINNKCGGRWMFSIEKTSKQPRLDINDCWREVMMMIIGEQFDDRDANDICGAVVNIRARQDKVSIWTRNAKDTNGVLRIGRKLRDDLKKYQKFSDNIFISYQNHVDSISRTGSQPTTSFTV